MNLREYIPTEALKPFIRVFQIIESRNGSINRIIPSTSSVLAFRLSGQIAYLNGAQRKVLPTATFSGLRNTVRLIHYMPSTSALIIHFTEIGAASLLKKPLHELFEQSIALNNFFGQTEIAIIEERLLTAETDKVRVKLVENFLLSKLAKPMADQLIHKALSDIYQKNGLLKIRTLADNLFISQDALEKRFRKMVGTSPKKFASIVRMKAITQSKPNALIRLALENGYYDQPHFNREFKRFTGLTPLEFYQNTLFW